MSGARFKNVSSLDDMLGWQQKSFNLAFQIGADGISEYTMEQIKAKSAVMGLNDELTAQALALASDADFTAKASAKKITYKDAVDKYLDDNYDAIGEALKNNKKLKQSTVDALESAAKEGVDKYKETIKNVVNYTGGIADGIDIADDIVDIGSSAASATSGVSGLGAAFKGLAANAKSLFVTLATNPLTYFVSFAAISAKILYDQANAFNKAKEQAQESQQSYSDAASQVTSINSQLQDTNSQIESLQSKGPLSITEQAELERLQLQNAELERQLALSQKLADTKSKQAADDAVSALNKSVPDLTAERTVSGGHGDVSVERITYDNHDIITTTKNELKELQRLKDKERTLLSERDGASKSRKSAIDSEIEAIRSQVKVFDSEVSKHISNLNDLKENFIDQTTGVAKDGYESYYNDLTGLIDSYNMIDLTPLERKVKSIEDAFDLEENSNAKSSLEDLADSGASVDELASAFDKLGISIDGVTSKDVAQYFKGSLDIDRDSIDEASASFEKYSQTVSNATSNLASLKTAISESVSGSGLSADSVTAFKTMFGDDAEDALEKTANGYHLNKKALAELQQQQNARVKSDYLSSLSDQYDQLRQVQEEMAKNVLLGNDVSGYETQIASINEQIASLQELQYQYESANSAYQQWQASLSGGEEGDMYDSIFSNLESSKDLYDQGLVGTNQFREFADLISNQDLSTASTDQIVAAYEQAIPKIQRYFTEGQEGAQRFLADIQNLNSEWAHMNSDGSWEINFGVGNDQEIADRLGIDVETVQAIMRKLSDYGFDINLDDPIASLEELKSTAQSAKEELESLNDSSLSEINLDSNSLDEVNDQISSVEEYIQKINEDTSIGPEVKTDKLDSANEILEYLVEKKEELSNSTDISIELNSEEVIEDLENMNEKLKELDKTDFTFNFKANSDEIDNQINHALEMLDQFKNADGTINIKTEGASEAVSILQGLLSRKEELNSPAVMSVDVSQVDGEIGSAIGKVQELQRAISDLNIANEMKAAGVDVDTSQAQQKVQDLAGQIDSLDGNVKASLGLDTSSFDTALSTIQSQKVDVKAGVNLETSALGTITAQISAISPKMMVKAGVDSSLVDGYQAPQKDAKVKYTVDKSAVDAYDPADKSAKLTYNIVTSGKLPGNASRTLTYHVKTEGSAGANGTAHAGGTANRNSGHAYTSGSWGIERNEIALVGEIGTELVVRNGRFFTVGDRGAEFVNLRKDDIVFNSKQTSEIFKNGYVTSGNGRGRIVGGSYADGSAYSSGSGKFNVGGSGNKSSSSSSSSKKSSSSSSKSSGSSSSSNKSSSNSSNSSEDKFEEVMDYVEIYLKRSSELTEKLVDAIDAATTLAGKQEANSKALSQISSEITANQQGYNKYISQANSVGLSESYAKQVRDGSLNIETITDESLKEKIDDYSEYYEKAVDCEKQIAELQKQQRELALERLEYISDYYDKLVEVNSTLQDLNEERIAYNDNIGSSATSDYVKQLLTSSVNAEQTKYNDLVKQLADYQEEFNSLVSQGYITKGSDAYLEAQATINEFNQEIIESSNALIELQDQIRELNYTKLQQTIDALDRSAQRLENSTNYTESKGEDVSESDLQKQIDNANQQIQANYDKRNALLEEQALYDVGSKRYQEIADEIADLDDSIYDSLENIEDLKNKIWEIRWEPFFDGQKALSDLITETDDLRNLLNDDAFIGKNGGLTSEGIANIALISQGMNAAKQQIRDYGEALEKLNEDLKNGNISTSEYEEQQKDFLSSIRDSVGVVEDYKDEIIDLWKSQLEAENDVIQSSIDKHKELLQAKKDNDSYSRNIKSQTKEINQLQAQISALSGVKEICPSYSNCWEALKPYKLQHRDEISPSVNA